MSAVTVHHQNNVNSAATTSVKHLFSAASELPKLNIGDSSHAAGDGKADELMFRTPVESATYGPQSSSSVRRNEVRRSYELVLWELVLKTQNRFIKHGRSGKPKARAICINTKTGDITWNGKSKGLNVKDLINTSFGKESKAFQRDWAFGVDEERCLTLHFPSRDVCLEAESKEHAEAFADALETFEAYFRELKQKKKPAKVERVGSVRRTRKMAEEMMEQYRASSASSTPVSMSECESKSGSVTPLASIRQVKSFPALPALAMPKDRSARSVPSSPVPAATQEKGVKSMPASPVSTKEDKRRPAPVSTVSNLLQSHIWSKIASPNLKNFRMSEDFTN
eukprot:TRINITY_DN133_c0_g1_i1.p1 TRINITY_DN133_c0_g1~~TRINITY_DN133_c0_g1_i1.p1  ORF type:complete len:338 (-),score=78.32 TRINITY_DN133_c0_g1_i1:78-1091(-)